MTYSLEHNSLRVSSIRRVGEEAMRLQSLRCEFEAERHEGVAVSG